MHIKFISLTTTLLVLGFCISSTGVANNDASYLVKVAENSDNPIHFESPLISDVFSDEPRSIKELIEGSPLFAPIEGLPAEYWKEEVCSNCHNWDKASLCTQGQFYVERKKDVSERIQHPFGGFFKRALEQWASGGCK